jgi:uncharacterized membrane protein YdcZ (DUF606 family)
MKKESTASLVGWAVVGVFTVVAAILASALITNIAWDLFDLGALTGLNPTWPQWVGLTLIWVSFFGSLSTALGDS